MRSPSSDIKVAPSLEGNAAQAWKYDAPSPWASGLLLTSPATSALRNSWIPYPGIFLDSNQGVSRKVGEFVGAAGSNAGGVRQRIRASSDKAAQHLAHALGESVVGGNPGTPYALSNPACITSCCPYKLTYFPGYSLPHKNGVGHLFPDLRLVESTSPYPTMN